MGNRASDGCYDLTGGSRVYFDPYTDNEGNDVAGLIGRVFVSPDLPNDIRATGVRTTIFAGGQDSQDNNEGCYGNDTSDPDLVGISLPQRTRSGKPPETQDSPFPQFPEHTQTHVYCHQTGQESDAEIVDNGPAAPPKGNGGADLTIGLCHELGVEPGDEALVDVRIIGGVRYLPEAVQADIQAFFASQKPKPPVVAPTPHTAQPATLLEQLADLRDRNHWPAPGGLFIFGLRGCDIVDGQAVPNEARFNHFDDQVILCDFEQGRIDHVPGVVSQPGDYWVDAQEADGTGAPRLRPSCMWFTRGYHITRANPCLVPVEGARGITPAIRDKNGDGTWELSADSPDAFDGIDTGAIHIHACYGTPELVGKWSGGCTVVQGDWGGERWAVVKQYVWDLYADQEAIPFAVAPVQWLGGQTRRLLWGSVDKAGREVTQLQQFLNEHDGSGLEPTGRFDEATDTAYRGHQRYNGAVGDGICVNPSWVMKPA